MHAGAVVPCFLLFGLVSSAKVGNAFKSVYTKLCEEAQCFMGLLALQHFQPLTLVKNALKGFWTVNDSLEPIIL